MNTLFKFVDEVVFKPYLASKGLNMAEMTTQSIRNQRTRATNKWDALLNNIDIHDVKHNSRRWIVVRYGEFSVQAEHNALEAERVLPYDSFTLGFVDYAPIVEKMRAVLPKTVSVNIMRNATTDGHALLSFQPTSDGSGYISTLVKDALSAMVSNTGVRTEFYLDPVSLDPYSNKFAGQVTDDLAFWMGDVVDALDSASKIGGGMRDALIRAMRERRGKTHFEYTIPTHDTTEQFERFLDKIGTKFEDTTTQVIKQMPVAKHGKLASRRWGIEVETGGARGVTTPDEWDRKYDGSLTSAYTSSGTHYIDPEDCPDYDHVNETVTRDFRAGDWYYDEKGRYITVQEAGTLTIPNPDYEPADYCSSCGDVELDEYYDGDDSDCAEFVSPILKSFHSRGLESLIDQLQHNPQNNSAGIHVHVEADDLTPKMVGAVVVSYQVIEKLIESSYNRTARSYCKPRSPRDVIQVMKGVKVAKKVPSRHDYDNDFVTGDRYHSVNLCALSAHGTIEFRAMGPVTEAHNMTADSGIDYDHLIKWASFCREIVNVAKAGAPIREWSAVKNFQDVINIFVRYGKEVPSILGSELAEQLADISEMAEV